VREDAMHPATDPTPIPWPDEVRVLVRDGYACRRCRVAVVADEERRVVRVRDDDDPRNILTLCIRCAREHEEQLAARRRARHVLSRSRL
jgi:hypothetical protein